MLGDNIGYSFGQYFGQFEAILYNFSCCREEWWRESPAGQFPHSPKVSQLIFVWSDCIPKVYFFFRGFVENSPFLINSWVFYIADPALWVLCFVFFCWKCCLVIFMFFFCWKCCLCRPRNASIDVRIIKYLDLVIASLQAQHGENVAAPIGPAVASENGWNNGLNLLCFGGK